MRFLDSFVKGAASDVQQRYAGLKAEGSFECFDGSKRAEAKGHTADCCSVV